MHRLFFRTTAVSALMCALAAVGAAQAQPAGGSAPIALSPTRGESGDSLSAGGIIAALYTSISGPAGQKRDWDRFRSLFISDARLMVARGAPRNGRPAPVVRTTTQYMNSSASLEQGFFEREIAGTTHPLISRT